MKLLKALLILILLAGLLILGSGAYFWAHRVSFLEKAANQAGYELFEGTLRLKDVHLKKWRITLDELEGIMTIDNRKVPIKIERLETQTSLWESLATRRSEVFFQNFGPQAAAQSAPLSGQLEFFFGDTPSFNLQAPLTRIWIQDYAWIDPVSFQGLSGTVSGSLHLSIDSKESINFEMSLKSDPRGGEVPARFLEFALPYLPKAQNTKELRGHIQKSESVKFINGFLSAKTISAGRIQAEIKMLFPEQNINLNLNLTILVDEEHAFLRAFKLLGLFKIQAGVK